MSDKKFSTIHESEDDYYDYCLQELKDKKMWGQADYIEFLRTQLADATRKLEEASKDARRYRWLREGCNDKGSAASFLVENYYGMEWDEKIDAALTEHKEGPQND
jgi:hypothetical protein